ncbi:InlB B-repeat-containing protein, partial [Candidatus Saccharibacteria bacterium]|nr:InlB B-repeat-containing protein [Candidatus Saccharibacteria bacterium]
ISTSSTAVGSTATALSSNTWGLNSENTSTYVGLPAYANATNTALTSKSSVSEESTVPIYYGLKVDTSITPGTYTGDVLYTVLMDNSCLAYTVVFNKNANDATGEMSNQSIMSGTATALTANAFARSGYVFLGWSTDSSATTATYTDGESVTDLTTGGSTITLYAIWQQVDGTMQSFSCASLASGATAYLQDTRDNQVYSVYRIPTDQTYEGIGSSTVANIAGKCIMTKDLNLGAVAFQSTASSTMAAANSEMTLSPDDSGFTTPTGSGESITAPTSSVTVSNSYSSDNAYSNKYYLANGTGSYAGRGYYSWGAAMVVCPKGWRLPTSDEYNNSGSNESSTTGISAIVKGSNAAATISNITGFPYLFVLGGHYNGGWFSAGSGGYYWSSTQYSSTGSYILSMNSSNGLVRNSISKRYGFSVRCIADVQTMQDFDPTSSLPNTGDSAVLVDTRDQKTYAVKRLPDGKVWMTQNLALGMDATETGLTLTSSETNIDNDTTYYLPPAGKQGDITSSSTLTSSDAANFSSSNDNYAKTQFRTKSSSYTNDSDTGYYNFYTATLGHSYYGSGSSGSSTRDICPKGWRLPKVTDGGTTVTSGSAAEFTTLAKSYNSSASWTNASTAYNYYTTDSDIHTGIHNGTAANGNNYAGFSYSGRWDGTNTGASSLGSVGYYWSSSVHYALFGYSLYFGSSIVYPQYHDYKYLGYAVRCIAQNSYTINYSSNGADSGSPSKTTEGTVKDGTSVTLPAVGTMVKSDAEFLGWALTSGATTAAYSAEASVSVLDLLSAASAAGQTTTPGSTITLYPVWAVPDDGNLGSMQSFVCNSLTPGHTGTVTDSRDNQDYSIYRFPDTGTAGANGDYPITMAGTCIMTKDLSLRYVTGVSITKGGNLSLTTSTSNFDTNASNSSYETISLSGTQTVTARTGTSDWSGTNSYTNMQYINGPSSSGNTYSQHSYYSYGAALVVCPKGWRLPTNTENGNIASFMGGNNATGSAKIRSAPYSFVYGGGFYSSGWLNVGSNGYYWASTQGSSTNGYYLRFGSSLLYTHNDVKYYGRSVRCVAEPVPTMQDFDASTSLPNVGDTTTLVDSRDGKAYTVKRLPDGKVWMVENLALGMSATETGLTLTSSDTNIDNNTTYYLPPAGKQGSITSSSTLTSTTAANFGTSNDNYAKTQFRTKSSSYTNDSDTGYYNFYTATLGFSYYNDGKTVGTSSRDICPKGWRLPKVSATATTTSGSRDFTGDFAVLASSY